MFAVAALYIMRSSQFSSFAESSIGPPLVSQVMAPKKPGQFRSLGGSMQRKVAKIIQEIEGRFRVKISLGRQIHYGPRRPTQEEAQADLDAVLAGSTPKEMRELLAGRRRDAAYVFMLPETVVSFQKRLYPSRNSCILPETVLSFQKQ